MRGPAWYPLHAYVLMSNHYHLLVQTPHANLSRAVQWLNVAYVVWFNRRHCGMTLPELASAVGAASAAAVGEAIRRMDRRRQADAKSRRCLRHIEDRLLLIET